MKRFILVFLLGLSAIGFISCSSLLSENTSIFESKEDMIGFSALSSVMTLHESTTDTPTLLNVTPLATNDDDTFEILSEIEELTPYLELVTTFMDNDSNFETTVEASDLEDYEEKMIISTINMEGESISYTLYYNETIEMDDDPDEDDENTLDEDEYDSVIEGIMIIDEVTYELYGEREVEEGEETLELIANLDEENYVTLEYGIEKEENENETEFLYEVFVDNQLAKSVEINFEQDKEETELSLKFVRGTRESEYNFEVEYDGDTRKIEIDYKIVQDGDTIEEGEAEVTIVYNADTDETVVRYEVESDGQQTTYDDEDDSYDND